MEKCSQYICQVDFVDNMILHISSGCVLISSIKNVKTSIGLGIAVICKVLPYLSIICSKLCIERRCVGG